MRAFRLLLALLLTLAATAQSATIHVPARIGDATSNCLICIADLTELIDHRFITYGPLEAGCSVAL